jgi:hypothetical protein
LGPLGTAATNRPIVPALGDYDGGEIGGIIGRGNRSTRRKLAPVPLCPPQTPHAARTRTRTAAVGSQRLIAWPPCSVKKNYCCEIQRSKNRLQSGRILYRKLWLERGCYATDDDANGGGGDYIYI